MVERLALTRHHPLPRRYYGYTAADWFKFYGLVASLLFLVAITYVRYFELFDLCFSTNIDLRRNDGGTRGFGTCPYQLLKLSLFFCKFILRVRHRILP